MGEGRSLFLIKRRCNVYLVPNETAKILSTFNQSKSKYISRFPHRSPLLLTSFPFAETKKEKREKKSQEEEGRPRTLGRKFLVT